MDQENINSNGPPVIDYREILARKKEREAQQPQPPVASSVEKKNFLVGVKNFWQTADFKSKIEIIILVVALLVALFSLVIMFVQRGNVQNKTNIVAPVAEQEKDKPQVLP